MESKNNGRARNNDPEKTIQQQIKDILPIVFDFIYLWIQIYYYIFEALFRLIIPPKLTPVKEEIVLVTGAGHGIGRELALQYAAEGATVVCWDINEKNNKDTAEEILKRGCPKPFHYSCDVSNRADVLKTAQRVKEDVGDVSILINNAGIMPTHPLEKHTEDEIKKVMDINVMAHFWTIEAFLPAMKRNNHGHIVALSSIAGVVGIPNLVPYSASKFAVRGLMETLYEELRVWNPYNQIKTTAVCPFMVNTGLCKKPYVKFENMLNLLEPPYVAKQIIYCQRTGVVETTIPSFLLKLNHVTRLFPRKAADLVKDFFASGVHSDL